MCKLKKEITQKLQEEQSKVYASANSSKSVLTSEYRHTYML
jgi:hypothetical protein